MAQDLCPKCGANLAMVGKMHRCIPKGPTTDVMEEKGLTFPEAVESLHRQIKKKVVDEGMNPTRTELKKAYNAYMKEYMRQWRAKRGKKS